MMNRPGQIENISLGVIASIIASLLFTYSLDPLLGLFTNIFANVMSVLNSDFLDYLHEDIGKGPSRHSMALAFFNLLYLVVMVAILLFVIFASYILFGKPTVATDKAPPPIDRPVRQGPRRFMALIVIFSILLSLYAMGKLTALFIKTRYTSAAIEHIERTIDIISPHIDERERLFLRSQYRQVNGACRYYELEKRLQELKNKAGLNEPIDDFESQIKAENCPRT